MTPKLSARRPVGASSAFSLVEVTIALGIVAFGLVAILGVLPIAFNTSRTSINQTRATGIMETVFTGMRAQPFTSATIGAGLLYPDANPTPPPPAFTVNLTSRSSTDAETLILFAVLNETEPTGDSPDPRRMRFVANSGDMNTVMQQAGGAASGYELVFRFNNQPDGMPTAGLANRITLNIRATNGAKSTATAMGAGEVYSFVTIIANRGGN